MCIILLVVLVITSVAVLLAAVSTNSLANTDRDVSGSTYLARSAADLVMAEITDQHRRLDAMRRAAVWYGIHIPLACPIYEADWIAEATADLLRIEQETQDLLADILDRMVPLDGAPPFLHEVILDGNSVDVAVHRVDDEVVITSRAEINDSVGLSQISFHVTHSLIEHEYFHLTQERRVIVGAPDVTPPMSGNVVMTQGDATFRIRADGGVRAGGNVNSFGRDMNTFGSDIVSGGNVSTVDGTRRGNITGNVSAAGDVHAGAVSGNIISGGNVDVTSCTGTITVRSGASVRVGSGAAVTVTSNTTVGGASVRVATSGFTPSTYTPELWAGVDHVISEIVSRADDPDDWRGLRIPSGIPVIYAGGPAQPRFVTGFRNDMRFLLTCDADRRESFRFLPDTIYFHTDATTMQDVRPVPIGAHNIHPHFFNYVPPVHSRYVGSGMSIIDIDEWQRQFSRMPSQVAIIAPNLTGTLDISHWMHVIHGRVVSIPVILYAPNLTVQLNRLEQHTTVISFFVREIEAREPPNLANPREASITCRYLFFEGPLIGFDSRPGYSITDDFHYTMVWTRHDHSSITETEVAGEIVWHRPGR